MKTAAWICRGALARPRFGPEGQWPAPPPRNELDGLRKLRPDEIDAVWDPEESSLGKQEERA